MRLVAHVKLTMLILVKHMSASHKPVCIASTKRCKRIAAASQFRYCLHNDDICINSGCLPIELWDELFNHMKNIDIAPLAILNWGFYEHINKRIDNRPDAYIITDITGRIISGTPNSWTSDYLVCYAPNREWFVYKKNYYPCDTIYTERPGITCTHMLTVVDSLISATTTARILKNTTNSVVLTVNERTIDYLTRAYIDMATVNYLVASANVRCDKKSGPIKLIHKVPGGAIRSWEKCTHLLKLMSNELRVCYPNIFVFLHGGSIFLSVNGLTSY
jgi:hypothetical protein